MCVLQFQWARKTVKRAQLKQDLSQKIYKDTKLERSYLGVKDYKTRE